MGRVTEPYQLRVIAEAAQLSERLLALAQFMGGEGFSKLSAAERSLLVEQSQHMNGYLRVLQLRIDRWNLEARIQTRNQT